MKKNTNQKTRIYRNRLIAAVLFLTVFGLVLWQGYKMSYRSQTIVLERIVEYQKKTGFQGVVLYEEKAVPMKPGSYQLDIAKIGRRVGVHTKVGTVSEDALPTEEKKSFRAWAAEQLHDAVAKELLEAAKREEADSSNSEEPETELPSKALLIDFGDAPFIEESGDLIANRAGILKTPLTGYESSLAASALDTIRPADVESILERSENTETVPGISIVDNTTYGIALVTKEPVDEPGDTVRLQMNGTTLKGEVVQYQELGKQRFIAVRVNTGFEALHSAIRVEGELLGKRIEALRFPKSALVEKEGKTGVYMKSNAAIVTFVPIESFVESEDQIYVDRFEGTVALYDEIFIHPDAIQEGDFIE